MKIALALAGASLCLALLACQQPAPQTTTSAQDAVPIWAFPINPPNAAPPPADDGARLRLAGSTLSFTRSQTRDPHAPPDWRPHDHPPMPDIVAHGRLPSVMACGYCHLPTGDGRPENARIAGLSEAYITAQMAAFKSGARGEAVQGRLPHSAMTAIARAVTDDEVAAAARYFSALTPHSFVRVVETQIVPKTHVAGWVLTPDADGATEPLGDRIVEVPDNFDTFEMRDPQARYIAYVPTGAVARGAAYVASHACRSCHGEQLTGASTAPSLAGRSPTYIVRQLYDFETGARGGGNSALMRPLVQGMSNADRIAVAAYLATLKP